MKTHNIELHTYTECEEAKKAGERMRKPEGRLLCTLYSVRHQNSGEKRGLHFMLDCGGECASTKGRKMLTLVDGLNVLGVLGDSHVVELGYFRGKIHTIGL